MILDVGSGIPSKYHLFLDGQNILHVDISREAYKVNVVCDALHLPFRDKSFETIYAAHLLEHLENPIGALREFKRIAQKQVIIKVPNASFYKAYAESEGHIFSWNDVTLKNLLDKYFDEVQIQHTKRALKRLIANKNWLAIILILLCYLLISTDELTAVCYLVRE